jgi:SAM-dependent methyltransferase
MTKAATLNAMVYDVWAAGDAYEAYVGRWSRPVAVAFLAWLGVPGGQRWLDVGCGTGALTATILTESDPAQVTGVDTSEGFIASARRRVEDPRVTFHVGDAQSLPVPDRHVNAVVSGLALNFVPDPRLALAEFVRVTRPGGLIAAYVWDYAEGMAMMRHFWDAAVSLDPTAADLDEGRRFPLCRPEPLRTLWTDVGLHDVTVHAIDVATEFVDFDDYWSPFLGGQGPAPGYVRSLTQEHRHTLSELLRTRLSEAGAAIQLTARAWAVSGIVR